MKVYQVTMPYHDGDHEHGHYESPIFKTREDAEKFLKALIEMDVHDKRKWWTYSWYPGQGDVERVASINTLEIREFDENFEIKDADYYLNISYT